jgi:hypothetical protein
MIISDLLSLVSVTFIFFALCLLIHSHNNRYKYILQFLISGFLQRRLLAVYLHHDGSVLTNVFCTQLLGFESVLQCLNNHFVVWGWDLTHESNKLKWVLYLLICVHVNFSILLGCETVTGLLVAEILRWHSGLIFHDILTFEAETITTSQNVRNQVPSDTVPLPFQEQWWPQLYHYERIKSVHVFMLHNF